MSSEPAQVTYTGGQAPYFVCMWPYWVGSASKLNLETAILPGGQIASDPIEVFPEQSVPGSYTWQASAFQLVRSI
jgi:hypothetical protein